MNFFFGKRNLHIALVRLRQSHLHIPNRQIRHYYFEVVQALRQLYFLILNRDFQYYTNYTSDTRQEHKSRNVVCSQIDYFDRTPAIEQCLPQDYLEQY